LPLVSNISDLVSNLTSRVSLQPHKVLSPLRCSSFSLLPAQSSNRGITLYYIPRYPIPFSLPLFPREFRYSLELLPNMERFFFLTISPPPSCPHSRVFRLRFTPSRRVSPNCPFPSVTLMCISFPPPPFFCDVLPAQEISGGFDARQFYGSPHFPFFGGLKNHSAPGTCPLVFFVERRRSHRVQDVGPCSFLFHPPISS